MIVPVKYKDKIYTYSIDQDTTIGDVKSKIGDEIKCHKELFSIKYGVLFMLDHKIISNLNMQKDEFLEVYFEKIQLFIKTTKSNGGVYSFLIQLDESVLALKQQISNKENILLDSIKLSYAGEVMENVKVLYHYRVAKDSSITMIAFLKAGWKYLI